MKYSLFLVLLLCNLTFADSAPSWAIRGGGPGNDNAVAVRTDDTGSVYTAGYFYGTASFGGASLVSQGATDIVLAKYGKDGSPQWSRSYGSVGTEIVTGLALDGSSNLVVSGYAIAGTWGGATLGQYDAWLAKFTSAGDLLWVHRYGGPSSDLFNGVGVDPQGNIVVAGWFQGTSSFGGAPLVSTYNSAPGIVVAKYTPSGTHLWSKTFTAGNGNYCNAVAIGPLGSIVIAGSFFSWIEFGGDRLTTVSPTYQNIYLAKLDNNGTHLWSKRYGGAKGDGALAVTVDHNGDVLAGGKFYQQTDLGGGPVTGTAIDQDGWVAKYSGSTGNFIWGDPIRGNNGIWVTSMASDSAGNALASGYYYGKFDFGGTSLSSVLSSYDGFIAAYAPTPTGLNTWALSVGGPATDGTSAVTVNKSDDVVASGYFSGTATFGTKTLTSAGSYDAFVLTIPSAAPAPSVLSLAVSVPPGIYAPGNIVPITATVTAVGIAVAGAQVTFSATAPNSGQPSTYSALTDAAGKVVWSFTIPPTSESGKWLGTSTATKDTYVSGTATFSICSCDCAK